MNISMPSFSDLCVHMLAGFPFQLLVAVHILTFPTFRQKKHFYLKAVLLAIPPVLLYTAAHFFFPHGIVPDVRLDRLLLLLPSVYAYLYAILCYQCTPREALFSTACAHLIQNITYNLQYLLCIALGIPGDSPLGTATALATMLVTYTAGYFLFRFWMKTREGHTLPRNRVILHACLIIAFVMLSSWRIPDTPWETEIYLAFIFGDLFALVMQIGLLHETDLSLKYELIEQLLSSEQKKQKMTSESVALINQKCHDLKYQIDGLKRMRTERERDEYIDQIEEAVQIFERAVKTGNETLDLILMEKLLYCQTHDIKLTCVSDGEYLRFLDIMDLYALFGNALDNAIESVSQEQDTDKRIISMRVGKHGKFLLIHLENWLGHEVVLKDGLPLTSKEDGGYHGFGVLSILYTVKKYNGTMSIRTDKNLFRLDIMIPVPDDADPEKE